MSDTLAMRLSELAQHEQHFATADVLFRAGDPVRSLFLVVAGAVKLTRPHLGAQLTLQHARPGAVVAEASIFAENYHCEGVATQDTVVRTVPLRRLEAALAKQPEFARAWIRHLA